MNVFVLHEMLDASPLPPSRKVVAVVESVGYVPARPPAPTVTVREEEEVAATRSA